MLEKILDQSICLKEYISMKEYEEINKLEEICNSVDKTNLKLELDYKLNIGTEPEIGIKKINDFFYYVGDELIAYIGISSFAANLGEVNGMTHPDYRRRGIFRKLFELAMEECEKRNFNKNLLLSDGKSNSGIEFIKSVDGDYDFSEYRMRLLNKTTSEVISPINLRKAEKHEGKEIARQNAIFFNDLEGTDSFEEEENLSTEITYMIELKEEVIGKIKVDYRESSAFIFGFGILPDFRGKGYGRAALKSAIELINEKNIDEIELDVECKNNTALNLYKSCGFEEKSIMNYYKYTSIDICIREAK